tara:strand:- start:169 stop:345 length:177 start_codon:yes stop_codon:yes gene_type:complete
MKEEITIKKALIRDLEILVKHYWQTERLEWDSLDAPKKHIFHSINNVRNFLIKLGRRQ